MTVIRYKDIKQIADTIKEIENTSCYNKLDKETINKLTEAKERIEKALKDDKDKYL